MNKFGNPACCKKMRADQSYCNVDFALHKMSFWRASCVKIQA